MAAGMMDYSMPPLPPDVTAQQAPPIGQFAQGQQGGPAATPDPSMGDGASMGFVGDQMNQIAQLLTKVVKVVEVARPELMPILQRMAQMGSMLMNEIQSSKSPQGTGSSLAPPQAQMAQGEGGGSIGM
jgi:hypothetical protein